MYPSFGNTVNYNLKWNLKVNDYFWHCFTVVQCFSLLQVSWKAYHQ